MKRKKACLFMLSPFLIGACAGGARPCATAAWVDEGGSLRVRQFGDREICAYLDDAQDAMDRGSLTDDAWLSAVRDVISSGNDITEREMFDGTLDLVVRDPFGGELSITSQATKVLMSTPEEGGFGATIIDGAVMPQMTMDEDLEAALARLDNGEPLTWSEEARATLYRMWSQIIDVVSGPIPDLQIHGAVAYPGPGGYSVEFRGTEIWSN